MNAVCVTSNSCVLAYELLSNNACIMCGIAYLEEAAVIILVLALAQLLALVLLTRRLNLCSQLPQVSLQRVV